jgi:hypothetical protein
MMIWTAAPQEDMQNSRKKLHSPEVRRRLIKVPRLLFGFFIVVVVARTCLLLGPKMAPYSVSSSSSLTRTQSHTTTHTEEYSGPSMPLSTNSHKLRQHQNQYQIHQHCLFNDKNNRTLTTSASATSMKDIQPTKDGLVAILHFGPRKTATTTIQYVLNHPETKALLGLDSFVYLGRDQSTRTIYGDTARKYVLYCILGGNNCESTVRDENHNLLSNATTANHLTSSNNNNNDKSKTMHLKWSHFVQQVQQARHNGQNVIVSDEAVPRAMQGRTRSMQHYLNAFAGFGTVRVVFGYRRLFDWIVSEYNEEFKLDTKLVTPFVEWYHRQVYPDSSSHGTGSPPNRWFRVVDGAELRRFHTVFPTVCVFNLHYHHDPYHPEEHPCDIPHGLVVKDTMTNFLCHMIPEARHACVAACAGRLPEPPVEQQNVSPMTIVSDFIARRVAKELRWMNPHRNQVDAFSSKIQAYSSSAQHDTTTANETINRSSGPTIPMICLSQDEVERLYQKSLVMEQEMVPIWYSSSTLTSLTKNSTTLIHTDQEVVVAEEEDPNFRRRFRSEQVLREAFENAVSKGKFCNVDFLQLWDNGTWRVFLEETANHVRYPPT